MTQRIVKRNRLYCPQRRILLWWFDYKDSAVDQLGEYWEFSRTFNTLEQAIDFVKSIEPIKDEVVWLR